MKRIKLKLLSVLLLFIAGSVSTYEAKATPMQVAVSFQFFYDELSPHGSWISYPDHGYVWVPRHRVGFRPYHTNGHWVYTDMGWMWVSDYAWGWAPFHYGTWAYDSYYGWVWVPGYDWAPAWVEWGSYGGYYGWAPISPGYSFGVAYYPPVEHWVFVHPSHMMVADWRSHAYVAHNHRISMSANIVLTDANRVSIVDNRNSYNNRQYFAGPQRQEVERTSRTRLQPVAIKERDKPGRMEASGNSMNVYRPRITRDATTARPSNVQPRERQKAVQSSPGRKDAPAAGNRREKASEVYPIPERKQPANNDRQQQEKKTNRIPAGRSPAEKQTGHPPRQNSIEPSPSSREQASPHQKQSEQQRQINKPSREVKPTRNPQQDLPKAPVEKRQEKSKSQGHREAGSHGKK